VTRPSDVDRLADASLRYVLACQPLHERLRDAATQLGGLSLMVMLRRDGGVDRATPLRDLTAGLDATSDALAAIRVPAAAAHHAHHMIEATAALRSVARLLAPGAADEAARAGISIALRSATDHLRFAARALPGFEMVDLTQSCCAAHAAALPPATTNELRF
jgi:hypothetical protein